MSPEQAPQRKPDKPDPNRRFMVGAVRRDDGTLDTSRAMWMNDPEGRLGRSVDGQPARDIAEADAKFRESLKIPDFVEPGSTEMVTHTLDNAVRMQEHAIEQARASGRPVSAGTEKRLAKARLQRELVDEALKRHDEVRRRTDPSGPIHTTVGKISAADMMDVVDDQLESPWSAQMMDGADPEETMVMIGDQEYSLTDAMSAASDLQVRLSQEGSRVS